MFHKIKKFSLPDVEEKVLKFWRTNHIFEEAEKKNKNKKKFIFYEGPPTANGRPGIHHVLARVFKDIILRYKIMRGYDVPRKAGWDTHGLPVELEIEEKLGFNSKEEIEKYGIEKFNQKCEESVWKYKDEWENLTKRIGFWIDMEQPYITCENSYMESLWWIIKRIWERGHLFKGYKVVPRCPRCGTTLSSHELAQGYKEVTEPSVYLKFKVKGKENTYILSWTTTPWTLPGNVALAVGENIDYVAVSPKGINEIWILAEARLEILEEKYEVKKKMKGTDLLGLEYTPLFEVEVFKKSDTVYKVYPADFVTTEEGTGVVHTAVMYGEDDYQLGRKIGLPEHHTVREDGKFTKDVPDFYGLDVKNKATEEKIFNKLRKEGFLLRTEDYTHEYPHCWRCGTPLIYYGRESWFFEMSKLRNKLLQENKKINWIPGHIKEGRFGEWIKGAKDWALSRERYWGTPLPIWECGKCGKLEVIGSMAELSKRLGGAKNEYFAIRHGEAGHNVANIMSSNPEEENSYKLTNKGKKEVQEKIKELKKMEIDLIFSSDFKRTLETAEIVSKGLGVRVKIDKRLREINAGNFNGRGIEEYRGFFAKMADRFEKRPEGGENLRDVAKRIAEFFKEAEEKYQGKKILLVSHEDALWMAEAVAQGWGEKQAAWRKKNRKKEDGCGFIHTGELRELRFMKLPRNVYGFADLHRPYVDRVKFSCENCGGEMARIPEVADAWFDSGAMPLAQAHFPFDQFTGSLKKVPDPRKRIDFPAEYISEAMDQTRGWFYTLLAISTLLGYESPYKNVISLGLILDKYGQKMSKSKGNAVDPWKAADEFGIDAIRWHFYTGSSPGEPKRFDGNEVKKVLRNFIFLLYNSFSFFDLYTEKKIKYQKDFKPRNVLDKWILSRLNHTIQVVYDFLEKYNIGAAGREIELLVDDFSRWYIRRSRRRFQKPESKKDFEEAAFTLGHVLLQISKITAPFIPFVSEALYQSLKQKFMGYDFKVSVHLEDWPETEKRMINKELEENMKMVRDIASLILSKRKEAEIKVRQPLGKVTIKDGKLSGKKELMEILKAEINVKEIEVNKSLDEVEIDTKITHELREEGWMRELVRRIQRGRQDADLTPKDKIRLGIDSGDELKGLIKKNKEKLQKDVRAEEIQTKPLKNYDLNFETKIGNHKLQVTLKKV